MRCLRVVIDGEEKPTYTITEAFNKAFDYVETVWWHEWYNNRAELNRGLKHKLETEKFDVVFMQLQEADVIKPETLENVYQKTLILNWTGDVRPHLEYFTPIGKQCVTLFSNDTDTHVMRGLGYRSDYWQTGYDHKWYYNTNKHRLNKIVFMGNNYDHNYFSNSPYRNQMVKAMKDEFGTNFVIRGSNWQHIDRESRHTNNKEEECNLYNEALIAVNISHINCAKYYSDRKLRAMACGAIVLSQTYQDADHEFIAGEHYDNWDDINQLIQKCHYYIQNRDEAISIGKAASNLVLQKCTWDYRMKELKELIEKYAPTKK
jgi:spore maturation protein CgeB